MEFEKCTRSSQSGTDGKPQPKLLHALPYFSSLCLWPFPPKRFKENTLLEAGSLCLLGDDVRAVTFGDLNGDQLRVVSW